VKLARFQCKTHTVERSYARKFLHDVSHFEERHELRGFYTNFRTPAHTDGKYRTKLFESRTVLLKFRTVFEIFPTVFGKLRTVFRVIPQNFVPPLIARADHFVTAVVTATNGAPDTPD
jgi:hypothetical protein